MDTQAHQLHTVTEIAIDQLTAIDLRKIAADLRADRLQPKAYSATVHRADDADERPEAEGLQVVVAHETRDAWVAWGADAQAVEDVEGEGTGAARNAVERFLRGETR